VRAVTVVDVLVDGAGEIDLVAVFFHRGKYICMGKCDGKGAYGFGNALGSRDAAIWEEREISHS